MRDWHFASSAQARSATLRCAIIRNPLVPVDVWSTADAAVITYAHAVSPKIALTRTA